MLPAVEKKTETQLAVARLRLHFERPIRAGEAPALRGFFGNKFEEEVLLHNHGPDNSLVYQYPKVQYKSIVISPQPNHYRFATPWLALNQQNFRDYTQLRSTEAQFDKLNRTLVGNTLSLCKSLGIFLQERLVADCSKLRTIRTTLKGKTMVGFVGGFSLNLQIPDLLGLGKSVSRGFGTIKARNEV